MSDLEREGSGPSPVERGEVAAEQPVEAPQQEQQLDQKEFRVQLDRLWGNAKQTVADLSRIGRELFEEQAARLGYPSERIKELRQQSDIDLQVSMLQEQQAQEVARITNEWSQKMEDPEYLAKKQREDAEWNEWLDGGLKWKNSKELSPVDKEKTITSAVKRILGGEEGRVLFHASSKDRLPPEQEIKLSKDFSLQAVKPVERYFLSSRGDAAVEPYVLRVISRNRTITQGRTGEFGEYGIDAGQELVRLPVPPERRQAQRGESYEVHTYVPKAELAGNELELLSQAKDSAALAEQINAKEQAVRTEYDRTASR